MTSFLGLQIKQAGYIGYIENTQKAEKLRADSTSKYSKSTKCGTGIIFLIHPELDNMLTELLN